MYFLLLVIRDINKRLYVCIYKKPFYKGLNTLRDILSKMIRTMLCPILGRWCIESIAVCESTGHPFKSVATLKLDNTLRMCYT